MAMHTPSPTDRTDRPRMHFTGPGTGNLAIIFVFVVAVIGLFILLRPMARQPGYVETTNRTVTTNTVAPTAPDAVGQNAPQITPGR